MAQRKGRRKQLRVSAGPRVFGGVAAALQRMADYGRRVAEAAAIQDARLRQQQIERINAELEAQRAARLNQQSRFIGGGLNPSSPDRDGALASAAFGLTPTSWRTQADQDLEDDLFGPERSSLRVGGRFGGPAGPEPGDGGRGNRGGGGPFDQPGMPFIPATPAPRNDHGRRLGPGGQIPNDPTMSPPTPAWAGKPVLGGGRRTSGGYFGGDDPRSDKPRVGGPGGQIAGDEPERGAATGDWSIEDPVLWEFQRAQRQATGEDDPTTRRYLLDEEGAFGVDDPDTPEVEGASRVFTPEIKASIQGLLTDPALADQEKQRLISLYRGFRRQHESGLDAERQIANEAVWYTQRSMVVKADEAALAGRDVGAMPGGSIFGDLATDITLKGDGADNYGPGFIVVEDIDTETGLPWYRLESRKNANRELTEVYRTDPTAAAEMKTLLLAGGFYPGAQEQYVLNDVVFDDAGNPIAGRWDKEDDAALTEALDTVQQMQATGDKRSLIEILADVGEQNQPIASTASAQSGGGGGGGYGGGGYGGYGGGGGSSGVSFTDADELKQLINAIARARLGMVLTDAQVQEFVSYYHQQEAAFVQARIAGQSAMQLDPESQAAAWIESRFRDQAAAQAGNSYITGLAGWLLGGGTIGSGT